MSQTNVRLTIVYDDYNGVKPGFTKSFGFAVLIEKNNKNILFDTGTKIYPLTANLETLGVSLRSLDAVILSHNHYDHTDGLPEILSRNPDIPVYVHQFWDKPVRSQGIYVPQKNRVTINSAREIEEITSLKQNAHSYLSPCVLSFLVNQGTN